VSVESQNHARLAASDGAAPVSDRSSDHVGVQYEHHDGASMLREAWRDGVVVGAWGYDGNGNRVTANGVTSTFDARDRQLTAGPVTYGHDAFGNRTRKTEAGQVTTYVYDGVGGLLSSTLPGSTRLEYHVDARGRRVGKRRNGVLEKGWLHDGHLRVVAETDSTGAVVSRFVYGTLSHSPDVLVRGGVTYRYVHDVLGSVRLVVNVATGQVAQRLEYDAWGVVTSDSSPGFQPFGFAGGLYDGDTRLTRFGARDYDAETGRWMSKDPIGFAGGDTNLFGYVGGRPHQSIDPFGLEVQGWYSRGRLFLYDVDTGESVDVPAESGGNPFGSPIPSGTWEILEQARRDDFFRLEAIDSDPGDDTHKQTGRNRFRLHKPGRTIGCIAVKDSADWARVKSLLNRTQTTQSVGTVPWSWPKIAVLPRAKLIKRYGQIVTWWP